MLKKDVEKWDGADRHSYYRIKRGRDWNGYEVWEKVYLKGSNGEIPDVGLPLVILAKGDEIRISTTKECFEYLRFSLEKTRKIKRRGKFRFKITGGEQ